jgi:hypothetical protein
MLRHLAAAAALLAIVMTATAASATVISGTWSFEVDAWILPDFPHIPTPPVIGSATFSFDNSTGSEGISLPASDLTNNFGSMSAAYAYDPGFDLLTIDYFGLDAPGFIKVQFNDVSTHFIEPSVPPMLQDVLFMPSLFEQIGAATFSGGFTPTPPAVPEPSTWAMLLLGFAGIGFAARRKTQAAPLNEPAMGDAATAADGHTPIFSRIISR